MATWLVRIRIPALLLGILVLLAAAAVYFITGDFGMAPRIMLVVGVLLVGIFVAIEPGEAAEALSSRPARYGGNTALVVIAALAILALLNFLSIRHSQRWDVTANKSFSLSDQTQKVLDNLTAPVNVTAFFAPGDRATEDVESLLKNYEVQSDGKLTWEMVDPDANPGAARQYGIRQYNTLVFQMGDKRQDVTGLTESDLTAALLKMSAQVQPRVYFTTGHGEHTLDQATPDSYAEMRRALTADNYVVDTINLLTAGSVPEDAAVVVIANPQNPLFPQEIEALNAYLDRAGHVFVLVDPRTAANAQELVQRWGLTFINGIVVDRASSLPADPRALIVGKYTFHPITKDLMANGLPLPLVEATAIDVPAQRAPGVTITKLFESSGDRSYVKSLGGSGIDFVEGEDIQGPVTLAVAVEADATNAPAPAGDDSTAQRPKARAVVVGDSDFATLVVLQRLPMGNRDFFVNAVNWLSGSEELASIRPRPPEQRQLFLSTVQRNSIFFGTVIFIPLLILGVGTLVWWSRR